MAKRADKTKLSLLWYRRDLRIADQAALRAAAEAGPVVPVFILDDEAAGSWRAGGAARWWLHHSLARLQESLTHLGAPLILRRGDATEIIPALAREIDAVAIHTGLMPEGHERAADTAIAKAVAPEGRGFAAHPTTLLRDPERVRTQGGKPYAVFTPFAASFARETHIPAPQAAPRHIDGVKGIASDALADWNLLPQIGWDAAFGETWTPGEQGAAESLADFLDEAVEDYATGRDLPAEEGSSRLSPHLHWGEISAATVWHALAEAKHPHGKGAETFRRELVWREFAGHVLWHNPDLPERPLRAEFAHFPWRRSPHGLEVWQKGRTGIPIVDAGMRQLWAIGWMHNRVRMITASFLVKHLLLRWQDGEAWFWDTLVDADLGNNTVNWQWVAGCGADAAPFFRIFNPVLQGEKFDPEGDYVRRWVPELARLDKRYVHAPWTAPAEVLRKAALVLGRDYPEPIEDLAAGRARALAAFKETSAKRGGQAP